MKIKIHSVDDKGVLENERIWLKVSEDVDDLAFYAVADTTYTDDGKISNELRHIFWLPKGPAKSGDWIRVYTKDGTPSVTKNDNGTMTHSFYWNLSRTVWNKGKDQAILFALDGWTSKAA